MKILFLDRDGTLMEDVGYPRDPETVQLIPGAAAAVRELVFTHGFEPIIISNQSGVARGLITHAEFHAVHDRFIELFRRESGLTLRAYYCLHSPEDGCDCRKPGTAMFRKALADLGNAKFSCVMIGDKSSDVEAGNAIGARSILLNRDERSTSTSHADVARSWKDIVAFLSSASSRDSPIDDLSREPGVQKHESQTAK